jgi:hypothetical protein
MAENAAENLGDEELRIETEPFGLAPEGVDSLARELAGHPAVLDYLSGTDHRLLAAELLPPSWTPDRTLAPSSAPGSTSLARKWFWSARCRPAGTGTSASGGCVPTV